MSIYFDFKTIGELIGDNYYREQKQFTKEELAQYDGSKGKAAYVAINGIVYDLSKEKTWDGGTHFGFTAGKDLTEQFKSCHRITKILDKIPKIGTLI